MRGRGKFTKRRTIQSGEEKRAMLKLEA